MSTTNEKIESECNIIVHYFVHDYTHAGNSTCTHFATAGYNVLLSICSVAGREYAFLLRI